MNIVIKEKDKKIVYATLFIVFIVVDVAMILGWQYRLFSQHSETLTRKKQSIDNLDRDAKNLDRIRKEAEDLDKNIGDLRLYIMEEKNISYLIEDISNLGNDSGVKITQIKPVLDGSGFQTVDAKDYKFREIEIQIVAKSSFHQLGNFISKIESAKSFFKVVSLDINLDDKNYNIQNIRLSLRTFINII